MRRLLILVLALALIAAACNRGDDADLTTTTGGSPTTATSGGASTDGATDDETTTTTTSAGVVEPPAYDIIAGDTGSEEYVVLVEPGAYTEQDLRNIMEDVVDEYAPVTAHLVDSEDAGDLVLKDELTDTEQELLDAHYLARIVGGTTLEFLGPYAGLESVQIGS